MPRVTKPTLRNPPRKVQKPPAVAASKSSKRPNRRTPLPSTRLGRPPPRVAAAAAAVDAAYHCYVPGCTRVRKKKGNLSTHFYTEHVDVTWDIKKVVEPARHDAAATAAAAGQGVADLGNGVRGGAGAAVVSGSGRRGASPAPRRVNAKASSSPATVAADAIASESDATTASRGARRPFSVAVVDNNIATTSDWDSGWSSASDNKIE